MLTLGVVSVTLAILSVPFFLCCGVLAVPVSLISLGSGIAGLVLSVRDTKLLNSGQMDPQGKGMTLAGLVCSAVGAFLGVLFAILSIVLLVIYIAVLVAGASAPRPTSFVPVPTAPSRF